MSTLKLLAALLLLAGQAALLAVVLLAPRTSLDWRHFFIEHSTQCWPGGSGAPVGAPRHCLRGAAT